LARLVAAGVAAHAIDIALPARNGLADMNKCKWIAHPPGARAPDLGITLALGLALFVSACRRRVQRLIAVTKERASLAEHTRREMGSQRTDPT